MLKCLTCHKPFVTKEDVYKCFNSEHNVECEVPDPDANITKAEVDVCTTVTICKMIRDGSIEMEGDKLGEDTDLKLIKE